MSEYEIEPTPGLPGVLPEGEQILWQGSPDWRTLARTAFHTRLVAGYFVLLAGWAALNVATGDASLLGVAATIGVGALGVGLLNLLARGAARTTIYTLTNRRIVMRIGMAVPKCINLPLRMIESVDLAMHTDGSGDLPLAIGGAPKLGYLALWPHARPWKIVKPQPMLRAVPGADTIAAMIARACLAANPEGRVAAPVARAEAMPDFAGAATA